MRIKKFKTDVLIDNDAPPNDDLAFIRNKGYKPTNLLRTKIRELKSRNVGDYESLELSKQLVNVRQLLQNVLDFIENKGLTQEFYEGVKNE